MPFNWDDHPIVAPPTNGEFNWEQHPVVGDTSPAASPVTAATTGLADLGGVGPIIGGAGKTAMDAITGVSGPLAGGSLDDLVDEYRRNRDSLKSDFAKAAAGHPDIHGAGKFISGGAALAAAGPAALTTGGLAASGGIMGAANSEGDITKGELGQIAADSVGPAALNVVGGKMIEGAAPLVGAGLKKVGTYLGNKAENLAEAATGATGAQRSNFQPGTGRELLDRKIVNFGSSAGDVAENANAALEKSGADIGDILKNKLQGTSVDRQRVLEYIQEKINALSDNESQTDLVDKLKLAKKQIQEKFKPGLTEETLDTTVPIAQAEDIKRGFQSKVNWKSPNPDIVANDANTTISSAYKQAVEEAATEANPALGSQFKADKETYGILSPVAQAAERRASTLNQAPHGGLLDIAAGGVGHAIAGGPGVAAGVVAKRVLFPRLASMEAVSADKLSSILKATPDAFGKFAGPLTAAAARGATSLGATDYILQQTNPEYREHRKKIFSPEE